MDEPKGTVVPTPPSTKAPAVRYVGSAGLPDGTRRLALGSGVITALLSKGGSAFVYEIWNSQLEVCRAVKLLHPDRLEETKERFETEVKISAKLHHPNIVDIYVVGNWNGLPYIEMERIDGITLEQLVAKRGAIPVEVCTAAGIMVLRALDYAHNQRYMIFGKEYRGIIHRDLKPGNVMLAREGQVKLMDFGIAKPVTAGGDTSDGIVVGTMQYLSPEQLEGGSLDPRSDVYSFGAVLYELLTGTRTFPEKNLARLVSDKLSNRFQPLEKFKVEIPPRFRRLVHRCLNHQREKRPQSASELLRELEAIHRTATEQTPEDTLRAYVKYAEDTRTVLDTRKYIPHLTTIIPISAFIALAVAGLYVFISVKGALDRGKAPIVLPVSPAPAAAPAPVTTPGASAPLEELSWETVDSAPETAALEPPVSDTPPQTTAAVPGSAATTPPTASPALRPAQPSARPVAVATTPATPAAAPVPSAPNDIIGNLSARYGTDDPFVIMEREINAKRPLDALKVYELSSDAVRRSAHGLILRMRALQGSDNAAYNNFVLTQTIEDAEFFLAKAFYFVAQKQPDKARMFYEKAMKVPGKYLSSVQLEQRRMLCRAEVAMAAFAAGMSVATKKEAMDSWYEIKLRLQNKPEHKLYQRADEEIRNLSD